MCSTACNIGSFASVPYVHILEGLNVPYITEVLVSENITERIQQLWSSLLE